MSPYLPEYGAAPQAALLEDSGKPSSSKMKQSFVFEKI
jgi:hypothetical protein